MGIVNAKANTTNVRSEYNGSVGPDRFTIDN